MSTTIANGYRLAPGISVTDFVRSLDANFSDARYKVALRAMGELVRQLDNCKNDAEKAKAIDFATSGHITPSASSISKASNVAIAKQTLEKLQNSLSGHMVTRVPELDCTLSIAFLSDPDNSNDIYAFIFTEQREYIDVWEAIEGVEEYFYWNGSDSQLATMTRKEWKARGAKWDRIVGSNPISLNSVSWNLDTYRALYGMKFTDEDIVASVADSQLRYEAAVAWAKNLWGDDLSGLFGGKIKPDNSEEEKL